MAKDLKRVTFEIEEELHHKLKTLAISNKISIREILVQCIMTLLEEFPELKKKKDV